MKSYLSLIPISAKVRRRQNRMTLLCIIFAVFLVTAIFSMADMAIRMERSRLAEKHGQQLTFQAILDTSMGQTLFLTAGALFLLILMAGVLMISGSINSTVAQRTRFFGMMRCIGMSRLQLIRFVRLEALNWCKTAIPIGVLLGTVSSWILCAILRFVVREEFTAILFLTFSVLLDWVGYLLPQSASEADITIYGESGANCVSPKTAEAIGKIDGVKNVFGRRSVFEVPAELEQEGLPQTVDLISFDDFDLKALKKDDVLKKGSDLSKVYGDNGYVLAICDLDAPLHKGDTIRVNGEALTVAGLLKYDLFSGDGLSHGKVSVITSSETFLRLTGTRDYSLVMVQGDLTDESVAAISGLLDEGLLLRDQRDQRTFGTYIAFVLCVYSFLAIIAMVTVLNIMNSISMSVSARSRQYGAMRAVGMDGRQVTQMIAAEAVTYALAGGVIGCTGGLAIGKNLFNILIRDHFAYAVWTIPIFRLLIVVLFVASATFAAIHVPAKRIRNMAVTDTVNEL